MKELDNFENHLKRISSDDWQSLFEVIDLLQNYNSENTHSSFNQPLITEDAFHYWTPDHITTQLTTKLSRLELTPVFDWANWSEGKVWLADHSFRYNTLDMLTLCKLLTVIMRTDRFNEGYLSVCIKNGTMLQILTAMRENYIRSFISP